jgi:capsular polysaccharide biosynthesis protein/Mrp family chromosome partitioning ATPase
VEVTGLVGTLRRWWATLVVAGVVAALGAWVLAESMPETYQASTRLVVGPLAGNTDVVRAAGQLARTDAEVATSQSLLDEAAERLGLDPDDVDAEVDASANEVTRLLVISVRDDDAARAADLANEIARSLRDRIEEQPIGPEGAITVLDAATVPSEPAEPNVNRIITLSVLATLVLAFGVAYVLDRLDDAVAGPEDIERAAPGAFVASVPAWRHRRGTARALVARPGSPAGAALRLVATSMELAVQERGRVVLVAGAEFGEGSEEVAVNLATLLATPRRRVLLVDASPDRRLHRAVGGDDSQPAPRSATLMAEHVDPGTGAGFDLLVDDVAGGGSGVGLDEARATVDELRGTADWVIVHSEPVAAAASALVWASACDATILVAQQGKTRRESLAAATDSVGRVGGTLIGVVLHERRPAERLRRRPRTARRRGERRGRGRGRGRGTDGSGPGVTVLPAGAVVTPPAPPAPPEAVGSVSEGRWRR